MFRHSRNPQTILVSFSGIDGAGKSTQISDLRTRLLEAGHGVRILAFWDDVATLKNLRQFLSRAVFRGDPGVGTPDKPVSRRDKNVKSGPMTAFRLLLYFADALSLSRAALSARRSDAGVVIFDRYLYDELANLSLDRAVNRAYVRLLSKIIPHPDLACVLDADPIQARARKPEYPLDFLQSNRASYLTLSKIVDGMTVVPAGSRQQVHAFIAEATWQLLQEQNRNPAANPVGQEVTEV